MKNKVYVILLDRENQKVGLNMKDSTLPDHLKIYEGKYSFFGGAMEKGETEREALTREIEEEIPNFLALWELNSAYLIYFVNGIYVFVIETDLSGHRHTKNTDRIGQLARACLEGDGIVRSFEFIKNSKESDFLAPFMYETVTKLVNKKDV